MGIFQFLGLTVEVVQQKCHFLRRERHELAFLVMYTEFEYGYFTRFTWKSPQIFGEGEFFAHFLWG